MGLLATAVVTKASVAIILLLSPVVCVGAIGDPVKFGLVANATDPEPVVPLDRLVAAI